MRPSGLFSSDNRLFELARLGRLRLPKAMAENTRRSIDHIFYPIAVLLFSLMLPILVGIFVLPLLVVLLLARGSDWVQGLVMGGGSDPFMLIVGFAPIYLLIWAWLKLFERRPLWTTGLEWPGWLAKYARGLLVGLLMFSAVVGLMAIPGFLVVEPGSPSTGVLAFAGGSLLIFLAWMVQGGAEELLTRGLVMPIVGLRFGPALGIFFSSLLFTVLHLLNPNLSLIALLNLFLFAVFAALYALYEGGLWGIFAIHTVWNWSQGNLFGFEVSGGQVTSAVIFNLSERGPDWLTGGNFGPEGGLVVTLVLVAGSLLLLIAQPLKAARILAPAQTD